MLRTGRGVGSGPGPGRCRRLGRVPCLTRGLGPGATPRRRRCPMSARRCTRRADEHASDRHPRCASASRTSSGAMRSSPGSGSVACGSPVVPAQRTRCGPPARGGPQTRRRRRPEEDDGRRAEGGRQVRDTGVAAHDAARGGDDRSELGERRAARQDRGGREPGPGGDPGGERGLLAAAGHDDAAAGGALRARDGREAPGRPAARAARRAGVDDGRPGERVVADRVPAARGREAQVVAVGRHARVAQQPAPPRGLVLLGVPGRARLRGRDVGVREGQQAPRAAAEQQTGGSRGPSRGG